MQSADVHRKNFEYKQKIDELNDFCAQLKEQLATKELIVYEQEVRIRDLRNQVKELGDIEEKLCLANRNARVLEEENNSLLKKLKSDDMKSEDSSIFRVEAVKLINENKRLQSDVEDLRSAVSQAHQRENQLDQRCKALVEQQAKADIMILTLEKRNGELEKQLNELENQWLIAKDAWEVERGQYSQDYKELLSSVQRLDGTTQHRGGRDIKERGNDNNFQQVFLKEEIAELEEKMRISEERFRAKEREWRRNESLLRAEINTLKSNNGQGGREVYRAFQDQLASFKEEVSAFRGERKLNRVSQSFPTKQFVFSDEDERSTELEADVKSKAIRIQTLEEVNGSLNQKNIDLTKENEKLREEIEALQDQCSRIEEGANEREVRIKELEVLVLSGQRNVILPKTGEFGFEAIPDKNGDIEGGNVLRKSSALCAALQQHGREFPDLRVSNEQRPINYEACQAGQSAQTDDLPRQNDGFRPLTSVRSSRKTSNADLLHGRQDIILRENEQLYRKKGGIDLTVVDKLSRERMDSVEDVMRSLESAWANEEEAREKLRVVSRQNADLITALSNGEKQTKDEELRKYLRHLDGLEEQRQIDIQRIQNEKDELKGQVDGLRHDNKVKEEKIEKLQDQLSKLEKELREGEQSMRKQSDLLNAGEVGSRTRRLEAAVADGNSDRDGLKSKDRRIQELNNQLVTMREANDGLWKQLVNLQGRPTESRGLSSSQRNSRSPRVSARRNSMEHLVYSQSSTHPSEERRTRVVVDGAHLAVTIVELSDILRNGKPITESGYVIIKVKSVKEKYKTSVKELASVIRFDETFVFYLAQPDEDVITLHVFYKPKSSSREYHVGDACFSMASLYRGVPRQRIAIVAQNPGTRDARRSAQVEVIMQSDDFGKMMVPTEAEIEEEKLRFSELLKRVEVSAPENLHRADVLMATNTTL